MSHTGQGLPNKTTISNSQYQRKMRVCTPSGMKGTLTATTADTQGDSTATVNALHAAQRLCLTDAFQTRHSTRHNKHMQHVCNQVQIPGKMCEKQ